MSLHDFTFWHWLTLGLIAVIIEVAAGGSFAFLVIGCAALLTGVVVWLLPPITPEHWYWPFLGFVVLCGIGLFLLVTVGSHLLKPAKRTNLNRRGQQYIGRILVLQEALVNNRGHVRVDDSSWRIEGPDLPAGTKVKVIGVDGVLLKIEKFEDK